MVQRSPAPIRTEGAAAADTSSVNARLDALEDNLRDLRTLAAEVAAEVARAGGKARRIAWSRPEARVDDTAAQVDKLVAGLPPELVAQASEVASMARAVAALAAPMLERFHQVAEDVHCEEAVAGIVAELDAGDPLASAHLLVALEDRLGLQDVVQVAHGLAEMQEVRPEAWLSCERAPVILALAGDNRGRGRA